MSEWPTADDFISVDPPPRPISTPLQRARRRAHAAELDLLELRIIVAWLAGRYHKTFPQQLREAIRALDELDIDPEL